jgi:hypothetical protein
MARLRVRVELNRGGVGVPLHKLASVVHEAQKFFQMLGQDVHIEKDRGEWLGFDFDNESLNFTAEYVGPVTAEQVHAFCEAFDGVTSLRRATIAQFTRIADAIGEDELIGFGLYQSEHEAEPSEWRCLSRRDALRIADEIQLLLGAVGGLDQETHLPAVIDAGVGARLFKDRRERALNGSHSKLPDLVREVETNLSKRITRLEGEVDNHSHAIHDLRETSAATEESFKGLLSAVENFCGQATRQLERLAPPIEAAAHSELVATSPLITPPPPPAPATSGRSLRALWVAAFVVVALAAGVFLFWPSKPVEQANSEPTAAIPSPPVASIQPAESGQPKQFATVPTEPSRPKSSPVGAKTETTKAKSTPPPAPPPSETTAETGEDVMRVDLEAKEPVWVMITDSDGKTLMARTLQANETRTLELNKNATLRTGNAGGLHLRFNGRDIGPLGPTGKIRDVKFKSGAFKIVTPDAG